MNGGKRRRRHRGNDCLATFSRYAHGMDSNFSLWFEYLLRFSHLVAGIAWIGSSFYFIWLDSTFAPPEQPRRNVDGELFMLHGGFYYQVEKRKIYPGEVPKTLHWFKWEATLTWITGFMLFVFIYWMHGASLLIDPAAMLLTQWQAIGLSLAAIAGSWFVYDSIWKWIPQKSLSAILSLAFFAALIFGLERVFSGRGLFIMMGAIMGTAMLLNVWVRILPGQAKMLREAEAGQVPDYSVSVKSKTRSVTNTYFIFPVLFIMLSNHYPLIYSHPRRGWLLLLLSVAGALTRHAMVTKSSKERWLLLPALAALAALVVITRPEPLFRSSGTESAQAVSLAHGADDAASLAAMAAGVSQDPVVPAKGPVEFAAVHAIVEKRCYACHSSHNTDDVYREPPRGVKFESEVELRVLADKVHLHVVLAKSMPLLNKTGMTDAERGVIARWLIDQKLAP